MRSIVYILVFTALVISIACPSCSRDKAVMEKIGGYDRNIDLANHALDVNDTTLARVAVDSAELFAFGFARRNELLAYNILLDPHIAQINLHGILTALDSLSDHDEVDERIYMRLLEQYAVQLSRRHSPAEADNALETAAAIAYRLNESLSYVRIKVKRLNKQEVQGNYIDAVKGYRQLLDYTRKRGLRSSEVLVLYRLLCSFVSMGDIPSAQIYLSEMATAADTTAYSQSLFHLASANISVNVGDSVEYARSLHAVADEFERDSVVRSQLNLTYSSMLAFYYISKDEPDSAREVLVSLKKHWDNTNILAYRYIDLLESEILLEEGSYDEAKMKLDAIDAAHLRATSVTLYETYADVVTDYYSLIGDDRMAYLFLRSKTSLADSVKDKSAYHDLAYRSMEHKRDTTIVSQGFELDQMGDQQHRLEVVRTVWIFVAVVIVIEALGLYLIISVRRIKKRRREIESAFASMSQEIKRKKEQLLAQKEQLDEQNEALASELMFANHIQSNILQSEDALDVRGIDDHFIIFSPCNMVSGDFYWVFDCGDKLFVCVADATGHGVPGAFISMVASTLLSDIATDPTMREPSRMVERLSDEIVRVICSNTDVVNKDSLDLSLFCLDRVAGKAYICLARQTAYIVHQNGTVEAVQGVHRSVGECANIGGGRPFITQELNIKRGDIIYMTTDGFVSQFGGPHNQKFKRRRFVDMLRENYQQRMSIQRDAIVRRFDDWRGDNDQTDDVLMMGLKIGDMKSSRFSRFNNYPYHKPHDGETGEQDNEVPPQLAADVAMLLNGVKTKMESKYGAMNILDLLPLLGDCYMEWIDGCVRISPAERDAPAFILIEVTTIGNFSNFTEPVVKVVVTVPYWAKDSQQSSSSVKVSVETEKETARITFMTKN